MFGDALMVHGGVVSPSAAYGARLGVGPASARGTVQAMGPRLRPRGRGSFLCSRPLTRRTAPPGWKASSGALPPWPVAGAGGAAGGAGWDSPSVLYDVAFLDVTLPVVGTHSAWELVQFYLAVQVLWGLKGAVQASAGETGPDGKPLGLGTRATAAGLKALNRIPGYALVVKNPASKLAASVAIDAVGFFASSVIPVVGEAEDVVWAPISALLVQSLYRNKIFAGLDFVKEILPFTDFIPAATICWVLEFTPLGLVVGKVPFLSVGRRRGGGDGGKDKADE